jgi:hypothetical protein
MKIEKAIESARLYLNAQVNDGFCLEFHQLRNGPSIAWTTA